MAGNFKDHFSIAASDYARFRPQYPDELFAWLAQQCSRTDLAWDCATGNGQAARALAGYFRAVVASDASGEQIAEAVAHPGVSYRVAPAEASGLPDNSVNLLTVAQAVHWFDLDRFYAEARRVLAPGGVIALWCYGSGYFDSPALQAVFDDFYGNTLGAYWPPERALIESGYRDLDFPFAEIRAPEFAMHIDVGLPALIGYLGTWSATNRYRQSTGTDPLPALQQAFAEHWGPPECIQRLHWPMHLRAGCCRP